MRTDALAIALCLVTGCTKLNPAATCGEDGTCTDPAFPVCDVTGDIGGVPGTCVATPPCTPNTTTCSSGSLNVCDDTGHLSQMDACPLGCATDGTRCAQMVPSNNLDMFFDMVPTPLDLAFTGGTLHADTNTFVSADDSMTLESFLVPAPDGGVPILVVVGHKITLGDLTISSKEGIDPGQGNIGPAVAFLATDELDVVGRLVVDSGAIDLDDCAGAAGVLSSTFTSGGGGGGFGTDGAPGGDVPSHVAGGAAGKSSGTEELVPLRGGCVANGGFATSGGGAIQLSSRTKIVVTGSIVADGFYPDFGGTVGGGAGGGILIEAPDVSFAISAKLLTRGGGGASGTTAKLTAQHDDANPLAGAPCSPMDVHCGIGGDGAASSAPTPGGNTGNPVSGDTTPYRAGGGGGGLGRIRLNDKDGTVVAPDSTLIVGVTTRGQVTRN